MNNSKDDFYSYLIENKDNVLNFYSLSIFKIIRKHFPNYKLYIKDISEISTEESKEECNIVFNKIAYKESTFGFNTDFDDINKYYILINDELYQIKIINTGIFDSIFNVDSLQFYLININIIDVQTYRQIKSNIYKLGHDMHIKFEGSFFINSNNIYTIKIIEMFYNNFIVEKYNKIIYPFKYVIPQNCFFLIYKNSNTYNVSYFHNKNIIDRTLLNHITEEPCIYTITINPETNFYLNKMNHIDYESWIKFCIDYHVNKYNILYIDKKNINKKNGYLLTKESYNIFNKINLNDELLSCDYTNINFFKVSDTDNFLDIEFIEKDIFNIKDYKTDSYEQNMSKIKFLNKISNLSNFKKYSEIITILTLLEIELKSKLYQIFLDFNNSDIYNLLDSEYNLLYEYFVIIKILNFIKKLLVELNNNNYDNFYGLIKINREYFNVKKYQFKYKFEALFELILGNELLEEQYIKYTSIINSNIQYDNEKQSINTNLYDIKKKNYSTEIDLFNIKFTNHINQDGGLEYPLHHFMMGKGKTKVLTPLLALYFVIIRQKEVLIIVPEHLKSQTEKDLYFYNRLFNLNNNIKIFSDSEIKYNFLNGELNNIEKNENTIMLIDEFDSILDPLQSNFNITEEKTREITEIITIIKPLIYKLKKDPTNILIKEEDINLDETNIKNIPFLVEDINNILFQIKNNKLKENSNWGIHPEYCYAIPYRTKHEPLKKSNFSSCIMIIVLTLYYYIIIKDFKITNYLYKYLEINNLIERLFHIKNEDSTIELLNNKIMVASNDDNERKFNIILDNIFGQILLPEYQYNTSFIDIINIDNGARELRK